MKVSILTTSTTGGAGIAACRLHDALLSISIDSTLYSKHVSSLDARNIKRVIEDRSVLSAREYQAINAVNHLSRAYIESNRSSVSQTIFTAGLAANMDVSQIPAIVDSDIINFHWVSAFAGIESFERLAQLKKALVFTMHDEWLYTGGCHYSAGCNSFESECGSKCPQLMSDPHGLVAHLFGKKLEVLGKAKPLVVTPSVWLKERAEKSSILRHCNCIAIPNAFPTSEFNYRTPSDIRLMPDIQKIIGQKRNGDFFVLLAAASLKDSRKGFEYSVKVLSILRNNLSSEMANRVRVILLGEPSQQLIASIPFDVIQTGSIRRSDHLACIYSAADVLLNTTKEDNYPNVIIESMLCGTPVISFEIGGISEQINSGTGLLVPFGDVAEAAKALVSMLNGVSLFSSRSAIRDSVEQKHSLDSVAKQHSDAFASHLDDSRSSFDKSILSLSNAQKIVKAPPVLELSTNNELALSIRPSVQMIESEVQSKMTAKSALRHCLSFDRIYNAQTLEFDMFCTFGWSNVEADGRWSAKSKAELLLTLDADHIRSRGSLLGNKFTLSLHGFCYGHKQRVFLKYLDQEVPVDFTKDPLTISREFTLGTQDTSYSSVVLYFPQAQREQGSGRLLGIFLKYFMVS